MLAGLAGLVVASLDDGRASHRRLGGGDQGKVLARDAKQHLPGDVLALAA